MKTTWKNLELNLLPGHAARRMQQVAVALFMQEIGDAGLTPVQYSSLHTICNSPGIDQKTLATTIGYDTSTIASVIDRLEARGLVQRSVSPADRRVRLVTPTDIGIQTLSAALPRMLKAQERLLQPLNATEQKEFMRLMRVVIDANADLSTIPAKE